MGDYQVRFCERLAGETPACLLGVQFFGVSFLTSAVVVAMQKLVLCQLSLTKDRGAEGLHRYTQVISANTPRPEILMPSVI